MKISRKNSKLNITAIGLALLLVVNLLIIAIPAGGIGLRASAAGETVSSGTLGENLTWTLDSDGVLTISGTGAMENWYDDDYSAAKRTAKSVVIEYGVTTIGEYAFNNCTSLTSITIPSSVESIGSGAFSYCTSLTSVLIPASVINIGDSAFLSCISLSDILVDENNANYSSIDGVFYNKDVTTLIICPAMKESITIPPSVTRIVHDAFSDCRLITNVTIPSSVTSIEYNTFNNCASLTEVVIPSSVTSIGNSAFSYCSSLTSVTIPSSVTSIEECTFYCCYSLTDVIIPSSVTSIGGCAFYNCYSLTSVTIPSLVTIIGNSAFSYCTSLTSVAIPASVTSIDEEVFNGCSSLTDIIVDENNADYLSIDGVLYNKNVTELMTCPGAKYFVNIPSSVTSINAGSFGDCRLLTNVTIPSSVTSIGQGAFFNCVSLVSVTIPQSVTSIGDNAFSYCFSLTSATIPSSVTTVADNMFVCCSSLTSVTIPSSVTNIGNNAFSFCTSLKSVSIPSSVTSIGEGAFESCSSLTEIIVDDNNADYSSFDGVLYDKNATRLIKCPEGKYSVNILSSVTSIGAYAFSGCGLLTSITIPSSVTNIEHFAFSSCNSLSSITIPSSVTSIGYNAFSGCSSLKSISIPSSVTSIERSAFEYCTYLLNITVDDNNAEYSSIDGVLYNKDATKLIICPTGRNSVTISSSATSIGAYAFHDCALLTSVTIPSSVTRIGQYAFSSSSLKSIFIPSSVARIEAYAFEGCDSLTDVYYPGEPSSWQSIDTDGINPFPDATVHYIACSPVTPALIKIQQYALAGITDFDIHAHVAIPNGTTTYTWHDAADDSVITPTMSEDGVFSFGMEHVGKELYCVISNSEYPLADIRTTTTIVYEPQIPDEPQITMKTAIEPGKFFDIQDIKLKSDSSALYDEIYIDYGDGNLELFAHWFDSRQVLKGDTIKVYSARPITELWCAGLGLTSLDVTKAPELTTLVCYYNQLTVLDLSQNTKLTGIDCENNNLTELDLSSSVGPFKSLELGGSLLERVVFSPDADWSIIREFGLSSSRLTFSDFSDLLTVGVKFSYERQADVPIARSIAAGDSIDLSSEKTINGVDTVYTWYDSEFNVVTPASSDNGVFTFGEEHIGLSIRCFMTNSALPRLTLKTTAVRIATIIDFVDNTGNDVINEVEASDDIVCVDGDNNAVDVSSLKLVVGSVGNIEKAVVLEAVGSVYSSFFPEQENYAVYDLSLVDDQSNAATIVDGRLKVEMKLPEELIDSADIYEFKLFHHKSDGMVEEIPITLNEGNSSFYFYTDGFSPYVLTYRLNIFGAPYLSIKSTAYTTNTLSWPVVSEAVGYELYRAAAEDGDYAHIATIDDGTYSYEDANLAFNTTYWYKLRAYRDVDGSDEFSDFSVPVSATTALAPTALTAATGAYNSAKLSWAKVTGASGYYVYRSDDDGASFSRVKTLSSGSLAFTNTGLTTDKQYQYYVSAYRTVGKTKIEGAPSTAITVAPTLASPAKPGLTYSGGKPKLSWKAVSGATSYELYRSDAPDGDYALVTTVLKGKTLAFTDKDVSLDAPKYYKLRAVRTSGGNTYYSAYSAATTATPFIATPSVSVASTAYSSVKLSWGRVDGANGYYVYRSTGGADYALIKTITSGATVSFTNTGLTAGTEYSYKVSAYKTVNNVKTEGAQSAAVTATPTVAQAKAPTISASSYYLKSSWGAVSGATGYNLYRSTNGVDYTLLTTTKSSVRAFSDTTVVKGKNYWYKVAAVRNGAEGALSPATRGTPSLPAPTKPKAARAGFESIKISWTKSAGATGYAIYRSDSKTGIYARCGTVSGNATVSYIDTGLDTGRTYYYVIKAIRSLDGVTTYSSTSGIVSAKTSLSSTTGFKAASGGYESVALTWNPVDGATGYIVYRSTKTASSSFAEIGRTTEASYTDSGLTTGKTYYYKVRAYHTETSGDVYNTLSGYKSAKPALLAPTGFAVLSDYDSVSLSWNAVTEAQSYEIYRSTAKTSGYKLLTTVDVSETGYDDAAAYGKTYYYKVRSMRTVDGKDVYSGYTAYKSGKVYLGTPSITVTKADTGAADISWTAIDGADGYIVCRATSKTGTYKAVQTLENGASTSWQNTGLTAGKTYYYKVRAYREVGGKDVYGGYSGVKGAKV